MEETKPYEVATQAADNSPAALMMKAVQGGMDLEKIQKMMDLQERWEANQARQSYTQSMADFKKNPPEIEKDKHVKFKTEKGITEYDHASLGNVTTKINAALSDHGLSAAWFTNQTEKGVSVTCRITHILGHYEETTLTAANDQSGGKNAIQALGSTISYLQRYSILSLTGLSTNDMDNDGAGEVERITEKQMSTLLDMINEKGVDQAKFQKFMECENIEEIPAADFGKAVAALKAARGAEKKA